MLDIEFMDKIAMQFEAAWTPACTYEGLLAVANRYSDNSSNVGEIIRELVMIDLDRRWKEFSVWIKSADNADDALQRMCEIPTPADYLAESDQSPCRLRDEDYVEIIKHDFLIRGAYAIRSFPTPQVPKALVEKVRRSNPEITVIEAGEQKLHEQTWGCFTIGRRDNGEPAPFQWLRDSTGTKLICADSRDTGVSRNQVAVQYVCRSRAVLKNTSVNRCFGTNEMCFVSPGQAAIVELPTTIILNSLRITLFPVPS